MAVLSTKRSAETLQASAGKKLRRTDTAVEHEFDDVDEAQLLAAAEAVESATEPSSSQPAPSSSQVSSSDTATPSKPALKQVTLFQKPEPTPTVTEDPEDLLSMERQTMNAEWFSRLESELKKDYFARLKQYIAAEEKAGKKIFPPKHLVHSWSRLTPLNKVKVVVVGQDPYHGPGQACGLSFSVPKGVPAPPSLKNIYKEIQTEYPEFKPPKHGCLEDWAEQGVLLLNACLTVSSGQAGSHHGKGWEQLTKVVLKMIADEAAKGSKHAEKTSKIATMFAKASQKQDKENKKDEGKEEAQEKKDEGGCKGVVFLVWGNPAAKTMSEAGITEKSPNVLILKSAHPSPLSAHRGFLGNGHFRKANAWLEQRYGQGGGIDWTRL